MVARRTKLILWWRRRGMLLRLLAFVLGSLFLGFLVYLQRPRDEAQYPGGNLIVFLTANLSIVILVVLIFLVGRNLVKLIFDRQRKILGSKLKLKLVLSFVALTLVPTALLFIIANGLLNRAMEGWFSAPVDAAVNGAIDVAKEHYGMLKKSTVAAADTVRLQIESKSWSKRGEIQPFLEDQRKELGLYSLRVLREDNMAAFEAQNASAMIDDFKEPPLSEQGLGAARSGEVFVSSEDRGASHFIRVYSPVHVQAVRMVLVSTMRMSPEFSAAMESVNSSRREYEQLKFFKNPLRSVYLLTFSIVTGLILFSAMWAGFYIARQLAGPIQELAEGADAVAKGNYDFKIKAQGDDEMGFLVRRFNQMTSDLKRSTMEAERRRLFIETILTHLAVGVVALDRGRRITSINEAAQHLFGIKHTESVMQRDLSVLMSPENLEQVISLLDEIDEQGSSEEDLSPAAERQFTIVAHGRELKIICTAGPISPESGELLGTVLLFDDVTELAKAQHMAAWREVARRIAHEIKNPLTPIQLSAQRLQKLLGDKDVGGTVTECTQTIVEHVDSIKRLANEFSHFARMPTAELRPDDLNGLISDTIAPLAEANADIVFQFIPAEGMPPVMLDREQIRRILINLFDNAIAAIRGEGPAAASNAQIVVRSFCDRRRKTVRFEVADNGPGVPSGDKARIFEPYFTTKQGGTGLGLAIVTTVLADHQGSIRVFDNQPRGARFVVELPLSPRGASQRRLNAEGNFST